MKLLTHNLLQSPGTRHGYPLAIEAEKVETVETEFNPDFLVRMVEKLDYPGLVTTIATVCHRHTLAAVGCVAIGGRRWRCTRRDDM